MSHVRPDPSLLSSVEVLERTGVTYRQLDYWARQEIVRPHIPADGSGSSRWYTAQDIQVICVLCRLHDWVGEEAPRNWSVKPLVRAVRESLASGKPVEPMPGVVIDAWKILGT